MPDLSRLRDAYQRNPAPYTTHAARAMLEHRLLSADVEEALTDGHGDVIEDYASDPRGPSCLLRGVTAAGRVLHVVMNIEYGWIITVYPPAETEPDAWTDNYRRRRVE